MASNAIRPEDIRAFAARDRTAVAALKVAHWALQYRLHGSEVTIRVARDLFDHAQATRADYPDARERDADLQDHITLKRLLDRVGYGRRPLR